jgi:hypothetical protein
MKRALTLRAPPRNRPRSRRPGWSSVASAETQLIITCRRGPLSSPVWGDNHAASSAHGQLPLPLEIRLPFPLKASVNLLRTRRTLTAVVSAMHPSRQAA